MLSLNQAPPLKSETVDISSTDYAFTSPGIVGIYCGSTGNVIAKLAGDAAARTWAVVAGQILHGAFVSVTKTNTTSTGLFGLINSRDA